MTAEQGPAVSTSVTSTTVTSTAWHALSADEALARQTVDRAIGLSAAEVAARRSTFGPNRPTESAGEARWRAFLRQYRDPMQIVLLVAGVISLFLPGQFWTASCSSS